MDRRGTEAWAVGFVGTALITAGCLLLGDLIDNTITALLLLIPITLASVLGGWHRSIVVAVFAATVYALAFLPPIGGVRIGLTRDVFVLITFVVVAAVIGIVSDRREPATHDPTVSRRQEILLRAVSHDLRNPLSTIRAASTDLLAGVPANEERRAELLGLVVSESARLDRIVGNLLSVGRANAGQLVPAKAPEPLGDLIVSSVRRFERLGAPSIVLDLDPTLPELMIDAVQIDQVVANLVENAVRASPSDRSVGITTRRRGELVEVMVSDHGPGFQPAIRDHAFEAFRSASGSSGIGLAVCKAIVEAHGGRIDIVDGVTTGSTIRFTLPIGDRSRAAATAGAAGGESDA